MAQTSLFVVGNTMIFFLYHYLATRERYTLCVDHQFSVINIPHGVDSSNCSARCFFLICQWVGFAYWYVALILLRSPAFWTRGSLTSLSLAAMPFARRFSQADMNIHLFSYHFHTGDDAGIWNPSSWQKRNHLSYIANTIPDSKVHGGQHGAHLGPTGPRWAPCWPHELCYLGWPLMSFR